MPGSNVAGISQSGALMNRSFETSNLRSARASGSLQTYHPVAAGPIGVEASRSDWAVSVDILGSGFDHREALLYDFARRGDTSCRLDSAIGKDHRDILESANGKLRLHMIDAGLLIRFATEGAKAEPRRLVIQLIGQQNVALASTDRLERIVSDGW